MRTEGREAAQPGNPRALAILLLVAGMASGVVYLAMSSLASPRQVLAVCICLLLLHRGMPRIPALAFAALAVILTAPWQEGMSNVQQAWPMLAHIVSGLLVIGVFRAGAAVPRLGLFQLAAFMCAWLLFADTGFAAGSALLAAVACVRVLSGAGDEARFNITLGALVFVLATTGAGLQRAHLILCLLPLIPLGLDAVAGLFQYGLKRGFRLPVCGRLSESGHPSTAGRVLFATAFGWCGVIGWWAWSTMHHALIAAAMCALPLAFAVAVVSLSTVQTAMPVQAIAGTPSERAIRIRGLDGLRAFAVALVVLSHAGLMESDIWRRTGAASLLNAQVGVQIFFVLSGLLITHLLLEERARFGQVSFARFYLRRLLRIFPVYYAAIAVSFALSAAMIYPIKQNAFLAAVGYVMNFASWDAMESTFSHFWSLAVEEHFYFIWPLVIALWRGNTKAAAAAAAAAVILLCWWQASPPQWVVAMAKTHAVNRWTVPAALPILVGCFCAAVLRLRRPGLGMANVIGAAGFLGFLLPAVPAISTLIPGAASLLVSSTAIAAILVYVVCAQKSLLVRVLEVRPLVYLGTISYGIYVWQGILSGNGPYRQTADWPPAPLVGAAAAVLVAAISYRYLEKPVMDWKDRLGGRNHD